MEVLPLHHKDLQEHAASGYDVWLVCYTINLKIAKDRGLLPDGIMTELWHN